MSAPVPADVPAAPVTNARMFGIAGPAMLANLTTPLLGIVATAAIGRLGDASLLGGVAMAAVIFDCMFWLFGFLRMSTVALTAQSIGAGNVLEQRAVLARALLIAAAIGILLVALQVPLSAAIFFLMGGSEPVRAAAESYFVIRIWSAPCALANFAIVGWLVGRARAGIALALQILINTVNMALTVVLVLALHCGIAGAAAATIVAETVGIAAGLMVVWRSWDGRIGLDLAAVLARDRMVSLLAINRDIMIRTAALVAVFAFFTAQGARAGDLALAANAVLHNFTMIGAFFLDGMATAAEQLCGHAVGRRDRTGFLRTTRRVIAWGFVFGLSVTALMLWHGDVLIDIITSSPEVRAAARTFMAYAALAPAIGVLAYILDGIYIGATWTRDMRNLMLAALAIYLATWWSLQNLGNAGLWLSFLAFMAARGLLQASRYAALLAATFQHDGSRTDSLTPPPASLPDVRHSGHGSAVTVAASIPTSSARPEC
jgi:MATE family multidrug resistance protein